MGRLAISCGHGYAQDEFDMKEEGRRMSYLGDGGRLKGFVVDVGLDVLDDVVWDVVFVELEQTVEEFLRIRQ